MTHRLTPLWLSLLLLLGCTGTPKPIENLTVRTGTSFGMCQGYCVEEYVITEAKTTAARKPNTPSPETPDQSIEVPTDVVAWRSISRNAEWQSFQSLDERIGCPDCADGGAEWIELDDGKQKKRVTFEYGSNPAGIENLSKAIRLWREEAKKQFPPNK